MSALLTIEEVAARTTLSVRTIRRRVKDGTFPGPIALGPRTLRWSEDKINAWLTSREEGL